MFGCFIMERVVVVKMHFTECSLTQYTQTQTRTHTLSHRLFGKENQISTIRRTKTRKSANDLICLAFLFSFLFFGWDKERKEMCLWFCFVEEEGHEC